jgi:hypothetical protein
VNDTIVTLESNLYKAGAGQDGLIWSVNTESFNPDDVNKEIDQLADVLVAKLKQDGII